MSLRRPAASRLDGFVGSWRWTLALTLIAAPFVFGAVVPIGYLPLLAVSLLAGVASWARARQHRLAGSPLPVVPGWRWFAALHAVVLVQLTPLPPFLHRLLSPGSFALHYIPMPEHPAWRPLSVDLRATWWGLAFLLGSSLIYATIFRDFAGERWRRRLCVILIIGSSLLTLAALIQAASPNPTTIYGRWRPGADWAVFGPYVNRNHFAGYLEMVIPLAIAFAAEALDRAAGAIKRLGFWATLGGPEGSSAAWWSSLAGWLVVGLLMSQSRGGIVAFAASLPVFAFMTRRRGLAVILIGLLLVGSAVTVDLGAFFGGFESRGDNRMELWRDMVRLVSQFPVLGVGLNAFERAYRPYQTIQGQDLVLQVHNDYLQLVVEIGILGAVLAAALFWLLVVGGWRRRGTGTLTAGVYAGLAASMVHALVDFNWQIPANAATFAALLGLALQPPSERC